MSFRKGSPRAINHLLTLLGNPKWAFDANVCPKLSMQGIPGCFSSQKLKLLLAIQNIFITFYAQKLSGRSARMLPCYPGFCASAIKIYDDDDHYHHDNNDDDGHNDGNDDDDV